VFLLSIVLSFSQSIKHLNSCIFFSNIKLGKVLQMFRFSYCFAVKFSSIKPVNKIVGLPVGRFEAIELFFTNVFEALASILSPGFKILWIHLLDTLLITTHVNHCLLNLTNVSLGTSHNNVFNIVSEFIHHFENIWFHLLNLPLKISNESLLSSCTTSCCLWSHASRFFRTFVTWIIGVTHFPELIHHSSSLIGWSLHPAADILIDITCV